MITFKIQDHEINFTRQAMNAAHQAFPREFAEWNLALFQKGKAVLPGVTVREIRKPYTTTNDNPETRWPPRLGDPGFDILKDLEQKERERQEPAPQPVDAGGEWPRFCWPDEQANQGLWGFIRCFHERGGNTCYHGDGTTTPSGAGIDRWLKYEMSREDALAWLRANGHAKVADELEGDRFEPVGTVPVVGDVLRHGNTDFRVNEIDLADQHYYEHRSTTGFHRLSFSGFQDMGWRILKRRTGGN